MLRVLVMAVLLASGKCEYPHPPSVEKASKFGVDIEIRGQDTVVATRWWVFYWDKKTWKVDVNRTYRTLEEAVEDWRKWKQHVENVVHR